MKKTSIYKLVNQLEIKSNEIDFLLSKNNIETEQSSLSTGPYIYKGTHYGTISFKDF